MKYEVELMKTDVVSVEGHFEMVVRPVQGFVYSDYDGLQNLIGYMVEGSERPIMVRIEKVKED